MDSLDKLASPAVEDLLDYEPDQLFAELEIRRRTILDDPAQAGSFAPAGTHRAFTDESLDELREFGRRFFKRFSRDAYGPVCGSDAENAEVRQSLLSAVTSKTTFAAVLAGVLVAKLGLAPALAAVVAALVVRLFVNNAHEVMCEMWHERISTGDT
jgi:hypothetical protein